MKKWIFLWSVLTLFVALAFANNIAVIVRWWQAFLQVGGDSSQMPATCPGILPWLDWSAVDYSAVSTFIPLLGCICVVRGLVSLARGRVQSADSFPFFPSADQLNVALGLFGTLWGIIVIGYFRLDKVSMGDLMHCLHTALFSTLVAVVWVFMIDHPLIRPWMRKLLLRANLLKTEGAPLADVIDAFVARLSAASAAFDQRQRAYEEANERRQRTYEEANEKHRREYEADFNERQSRADAAFTKRLLDAEIAFAKREKETSDAFTARLAQLEAANEEARAQFATALEEARQQHRQALEEVRAQHEKVLADERARLQSKLESARAALKD